MRVTTMRWIPLRYLLPVLALTLSSLVSGVVSAADPDASEVVRWDRKPIRLTLGINQERLLQFPAPIQPGVPPSVARKIRIQAIDDTVYITAIEAFDYERFQVREMESGRIYLLDLKAHDGGHEHPVRIVTSTGHNEAAVAADGRVLSEAPAPPTYGYMELTRYAAKQVYAPERLTDGLPGLSRVPLGNRDSDKRLLGGASVVAVPLASWRADNAGASLYVSAIKLTNVTPEQLVLDPRRVRGDWRAATFQHTFLAPSGHTADTTTLYLISDRPFYEAVSQWLN